MSTDTVLAIVLMCNALNNVLLTHRLNRLERKVMQ